MELVVRIKPSDGGGNHYLVNGASLKPAAHTTKREEFSFETVLPATFDKKQICEEVFKSSTIENFWKGHETAVVLLGGKASETAPLSVGNETEFGFVDYLVCKIVDYGNRKRFANTASCIKISAVAVFCDNTQIDIFHKAKPAKELLGELMVVNNQENLGKIVNCLREARKKSYATSSHLIITIEFAPQICMNGVRMRIYDLGGATRNSSLGDVPASRDSSAVNLTLTTLNYNLEFLAGKRAQVAKYFDTVSNSITEHVKSKFPIVVVGSISLSDDPSSTTPTLTLMKLFKKAWGRKPKPIPEPIGVYEPENLVKRAPQKVETISIASPPHCSSSVPSTSSCKSGYVQRSELEAMLNERDARIRAELKTQLCERDERNHEEIKAILRERDERAHNDLRALLIERDEQSHNQMRSLLQEQLGRTNYVKPEASGRTHYVQPEDSGRTHYVQPEASGRTQYVQPEGSGRTPNVQPEGSSVVAQGNLTPDVPETGNFDFRPYIPDKTHLFRGESKVWDFYQKKFVIIRSYNDDDNITAEQWKRSPYNSFFPVKDDTRAFCIKCRRSVNVKEGNYKFKSYLSAHNNTKNCIDAEF